MTVNTHTDISMVFLEVFFFFFNGRRVYDSKDLEVIGSECHSGNTLGDDSSF